MTKLEKEDKQEKDTQKDSKILTKLLTMKLFLYELLKQKDKISTMVEINLPIKLNPKFWNVFL